MLATSETPISLTPPPPPDRPLSNAVNNGNLETWPKVLVTTWLDEVTHMGNAHADSLLVHFYR